MGRWAQRRHGAGSGGPATPPLNRIITASKTGLSLVSLTYNQDADLTLFDPALFESSPSGAAGDGIVQTGSATMDLSIDGLVFGDTSVTYNGTTPGFLTPQTVLYT